MLGLNTVRKMGLFTMHPRVSLRLLESTKNNKTKPGMTQLRWSQSSDRVHRHSALGQLTAPKHQQGKGM